MVGLHGRILSWYRRPKLRRIPADPARACRHPASVTCHQHARGCRAPAGTTRMPPDYAPYFRPPVLELERPLGQRADEPVHAGAGELGALALGAPAGEQALHLLERLALVELAGHHHEPRQQRAGDVAEPADAGVLVEDLGVEAVPRGAEDRPR